LGPFSTHTDGSIRQGIPFPQLKLEKKIWREKVPSGLLTHGYKSTENSYRIRHLFGQVSTLIKKKIKFFSYIRKIQNGAVAKSYMWKGFLIYGEIFAHFSYMRKPFLINDFATAPL
jgi:hypothetical protein